MSTFTIHHNQIVFILLLLLYTNMTRVP